MATDDPELAAFEQRRNASRKTLAIVGLVAVSGLLIWKCSMQVDRVGIGVGASPSRIAARPLELTIDRTGDIRGDCYGGLDDCLARAKVRARNGASDRVSIKVEPGAPEGVVALVREQVALFELVPVLD